MGQVGPFPLDHIQARSNGGETELANLALACFRCNASKWAFQTAIDPQTGDEVDLFDPRTQLWNEHFRWTDADATLIDGTTPVGRATVARLQMNHPSLVSVRIHQSLLGLHPETSTN